VRCVFGRAVIRTYEIPLCNTRELSLLHGEMMQKIKNIYIPKQVCLFKNGIE
jgi:hypothetical protein